ncbi:hypothetical protein LTR78_006250 [Recurvomyces mirabilis]|uniref:RNI-like protein n=1 Tax=Recurvomyces mirabilis TaxID=574656 RepID=A0AAE0WL25_9PEZI|nr:hypothetical protein LTR78_006250 [Recurvomyces mirabilis]KAK5152139.1 hypothetical protein LTS14_008514 [Recurvomyces mirabilis]
MASRTDEDVISYSQQTVDYWTGLVRTNLAKVIISADSDNQAENDDVAIDEEFLNAPRRRSARHELAHIVASDLHPSATPQDVGSIIQYEKDIVMLRAMVLKQRRKAIEDATAHNAKTHWVKRISKQGAWDEVNDPLSLDGPASLPMPVEVSDKESLAPFFAHLGNGGTHEPASNPSTATSSTTGTEPYYKIELIEFEKGALYSDGRVDLCKMATGPRNIQDLMDSLKSNTFSKHFLLGNNIIGPVGAQAIADSIVDQPDQFETWYLAGNCIDGASFSILVDSMVQSTAITNIWLKRNPLSPQVAEDVFRLITRTVKLRTLDLDQTELGDVGVAKLFTLLAAHSEPTALLHIYLNANGIGARACKAIADYLATPFCSLQSLYLSNNPIGDEGAAHLATGVQNNTSLTRLSLQSCGLRTVIILATALSTHPSISTIDLGQSYATEDLGMRFNWLAAGNVPAIINLITTATQLRYVNLAYSPIPQSQLDSIYAAALKSKLIWFNAKALVTGGTDVASVKAGQEHARLNRRVREHLHANVQEQYGMDYARFEAEHKRFLVSPLDVRFIDSVYRNRDAGLARRGLKHLRKAWDETDDTLKLVQKGTF